MPPTSLSQTPFFQHLLSSLPSLRVQIKDAVTASMKQWLLEIRNVSAQVGKLALDFMEARTRRWRARREKDPILRVSRVGSAVELVTYEKTEGDWNEISFLSIHSSPFIHGLFFELDNVLDNEKLRVDFKPLYECIHIYTSLDSLDELRKSYQADRKVILLLLSPWFITLRSHTQGAIWSHLAQPASDYIPSFAYAGNIRVFYYRNPCAQHHRWLPIRDGSGRALGLSYGAPVRRRWECTSDRDRSWCVSKSEGMSDRVYYDTWSKPFLFRCILKGLMSFSHQFTRQLLCTPSSYSCLKNMQCSSSNSSSSVSIR